MQATTTNVQDPISQEQHLMMGGLLVVGAPFEEGRGRGRHHPSLESKSIKRKESSRAAISSSCRLHLHARGVINKKNKSLDIV
jgi:hypothetical protein